jgi:hypothetical protein
MSETPELWGVHEDPDALLSEMLGRPLGNGGGVITGGLVRLQPTDSDGGEGGAYLPPLHHQPRLFNDPSCLPRGRGADPALLRRLQAIRDGYELRSACILPTMALGLTLLTLAFQVSGRGVERPYLPLAFLPTFFVYSVERQLRPRAAQKIHEVQRELRKKAQRQRGYSFTDGVRRGGSGGGSGGGGWHQRPLPPVLGSGVGLSSDGGLGGDDVDGHGHGHGHLAPVAEAEVGVSSSVDGSLSSSSLALSEEEEAAGEVKEEGEGEGNGRGIRGGDLEAGGGGEPLEPPKHVHFSSSSLVSGQE